MGKKLSSKEFLEFRITLSPKNAEVVNETIHKFAFVTTTDDRVDPTENIEIGTIFCFQDEPNWVENCQGLYQAVSKLGCKITVITDMSDTWFLPIITGYTTHRNKSKNRKEDVPPYEEFEVFLLKDDVTEAILTIRSKIECVLNIDPCELDDNFDLINNKWCQGYNLMKDFIYLGVLLSPDDVKELYQILSKYDCGIATAPGLFDSYFQPEPLFPKKTAQDHDDRDDCDLFNFTIDYDLFSFTDDELPF
ncbi:hypothetical protein [Enterococcus faecalis]|uniref:hypothetical protein n=1 Tax=Enterococcus faecalis TaxID=1351 RepID=UPI001031E63C|nr:hypothetical protein [Enterococcus faecalis]TBH14544.1 hypothetical protein EYC52_14535 [Enterococcus faecalis]